MTANEILKEGEGDKKLIHERRFYPRWSEESNQRVYL